MKTKALVSAITLCLLTGAAQAVPINPNLNDRLSFSFGPFFPAIDTKLKVGNQEQNFEDYLDDSATTAAIAGVWRISRHFRLNFGYWAVDRETSDSLDRNVNIGGITVPAGTSIGATFDTSQLKASLGWTFVKTDTTEFGADLGLVALGLKSELGASVPGVGSASFTAFDETYPLPVIGLYWNQAFSPVWSFKARLAGMGLKIGDDFDGTVIDANAAIEARPWQNFGLGLAYLYNSADATLNDVGNGVDVEWNYSGPFLYLTLGFGEVE
jgi:hypothetical protein